MQDPQDFILDGEEDREDSKRRPYRRQSSRRNSPSSTTTTEIKYKVKKEANAVAINTNLQIQQQIALKLKGAINKLLVMAGIKDTANMAENLAESLYETGARTVGTEWEKAFLGTTKDEEDRGLIEEGRGLISEQFEIGEEELTKIDMVVNEKILDITKLDVSPQTSLFGWIATRIFGISR